MQGTSLDVFVDCDTYDTERFALALSESTSIQKNVPYLDVSAAMHNGDLMVSVVNRNKDRAITADILCQEGHFSGPFQVFEVNGPDVKSENDFGKEPVKTVQKPNVTGSGERVTYTFPAHSLTLLKGMIRR